MKNYNKYIGIPYKAKGVDFNNCDCWGLVRLFYNHELGINLPTYHEWYFTVDNLDSIAYTITSNKKGFTKTDTPKINDFILFIIKGFPVHCGIYLGNNEFLHCFYGTNSCVERLDSLRWKNRIEGYYQYDRRQ